MTPRSRMKLPDTRLNWRDPDMPVIGKSGNPIDHHKMQLKAQMAMTASHEPSYKRDPTYNMRKDKP